MIKEERENASLEQPSVMTLRSPGDPLRTIILNRDLSIPVIIGSPPQEAVRELFESVEEHYVSRFWEKVLCKTSPYFPKLPFALASWDKNRITLVRPQDVLSHLPRRKGQQVGSGLKAKDVASFSFNALVGAIRNLKPRTVSDAIQLLQVSGVQRLNASPLVPLLEHEFRFERIIDELFQRVKQRDGRIAAMALVAMRVEGWLVLPADVVKRIGTFDSMSPKGDWGSPFELLTGKLEILFRELQPPQLIAGEKLYKNTKFRIHVAVLCSNIESSADLSWDLLYPLLRGTDYLPSLRDHWRALCRSNSVNIDMEADADPCEDTGGALAWKTSGVHCHYADPVGVAFPDPSNTSQEVILNPEIERAIVLADVSKEDLWPVIQRVEQHWIESFWDALVKPSTFDPVLPCGLSATAAGHSLIDPVWVYEAKFEYRDVQSHEALGALKTLGLDEIEALISKIRPDSVETALSMLTVNGRERIKCFSLLRLADSSTSFESLVQSLVDVSVREGGEKAFAIAALIALRSRDWLILPLSIPQNLGKILRGIHGAGAGWVRNPIRELAGDAQKIMSLLLNGIGGPQEGRIDVYLRSKAIIAALCTNLRSGSQLSLRLVDRILACKDELALSPTRNENARIRAKWTAICEENGPAATLPGSKFDQDHAIELRKRCDDARLAQWIALFAESCEGHTGGNMEPLYQSFGFWLSWLHALPKITAPLETTRSHITGKDFSGKCFRSYLRELDISARHKNMILHKLNYFFEDLATRAEEEGRKFTNPIRIDIDRFGEPRGLRGQGTTRSRIPALVLDEMKSLIVEVGKDGEYQWSPQLKKLRSLFKTDGAGRTIFCPILPAIVYIMLVFPLRTHQTRWLDSGEMDEKVFDFDSRRFVNNDSKNVPGRQSGVIRNSEENSAEAVELLLDFQVAVNKTPITERAHSSYVIPFLPPDLLWVLSEVMKYQKLHGAPPHLVKEVHEPFLVRSRNQALADLYPDICPLFRYRGRRSFYPPSHTQITYFWGQICAVWDDLNARWLNPKTGIVQLRPGVPKMSHTYTNSWGTWPIPNFDLHCLRVAGISTLLEAGLPLAVVAALAGHKGLAMTIHYFKPEIGLLRLKLVEAFNRLPLGEYLSRISDYLRIGEGYEDLLGSPDGLAKLQAVRKTNLVTLSGSGICPGASCREGLDAKWVKEGAADVPGARCPLCRFYVYGPAFLPGLVFDFNCELFELERKANLQARIREDIIRAEDAGQTGEILRLRGEDDRLDRDASLDIAVVGRLYQILNECVDALNARPADLKGLQIINGDMKLEVILQRMSRFDQLKELVEVSQILPATRHSAPVLAELELKDRLLNMLRRNGAESYLAGLPKHVIGSAMLELATLLESAIPNSDKRDKLLEGITDLRDVPGLEKDIKSLMTSTTAEGQRLTSQEAGFLGRRTWLDRIAKSDEGRTYD